MQCPPRTKLFHFFNLFTQVSGTKSSSSLSKRFTNIFIYSCFTLVTSSYYHPLLKTSNRIYWYSMQGKVPKLDNHILYPVLSLPRKRSFLHRPQSKPADGKFTELLLPFLLENKGRPWQITVWKLLCPRDSRTFELLVATFSVFTHELAMAWQNGKTRNLGFRYFSCTLEFEEK